MNSRLRQLSDQVRHSSVWRSIFRKGYPDTDESAPRSP